MDDVPVNPEEARAQLGLCFNCRHGRRSKNRRGSQFQRCTFASHNPAWPAYPQLPVRTCEHHESAAGGPKADR
jgi:hypothetical protein